MRFENWTIEDLIARCADFDEMTLEMDREEFAALRRKITELKQAGNSPVIPDGYVMVPKVPTAEMISSGIAAHYERGQIQIHDRPAPGPMECAYVAMLAAAPQSPGSEPATVPGKWIPVSERMPIEFEAVIAFDGDQVYGEAMYSSDDGFTIDGYEPCDRLNLQNVTHWMPPPCAPQEVK